MIRKPHDFLLWTEVAKTVKPLRKRQSAPKQGAVKQAEAAKALPSISAPRLHAPRRAAIAPPPITGLDRRTTQKLTRGNVAIEARLDLHGLGVETARIQLLQFLRNAHAHNHRTVLVITGKGESPYGRHTLHGVGHFDAPERQGRLRRQLPEWLHESEFRALISGYQPAHPKHGGGGAFYIRVRRG